VLFPTRPGQWMIHRMDAPADVGLTPAGSVSPMLRDRRPLRRGRTRRLAYEFKWDGIRAVLRVVDGRPTVTSRNGRDLTALVPELRALAEALGSRPAVLDGELGRPGRRRRPVVRPGPAAGEGLAGHLGHPDP